MPATVWLRVSALAESSYDAVGDILHYTYTVTNDGNVTLSAAAGINLPSSSTISAHGNVSMHALTGGINLAAQTVNMDIDDVGVRLDAHPPNFVEDH